MLNEPRPYLRLNSQITSRVRAYMHGEDIKIELEAQDSEGHN